jgi:hypothetical protein
VITASSSIEYAFEGDQLADDRRERPSVFTTALVEGLATGDADRDEDGWVSLNELYDYIFDRVRAQTPHQTPSRDVEMQGELYLARSRRRRIKPLPIPADLQAAMTDSNMFSRLGAVSELRRRLFSDNLPAAVGAFEALIEIAGSDIQYVAEPAKAALDEATLHPSETELQFDQGSQSAPPPQHTIRLLGPPVARICTPKASADWIHLEETAEGLTVSVDPGYEGPATATITLKGPTGESTIPVTITAPPAAPPPDQPQQAAVTPTTGAPPGPATTPASAPTGPAAPLAAEAPVAPATPATPATEPAAVMGTSAATATPTLEPAPTPTPASAEDHEPTGKQQPGPTVTPTPTPLREPSATPPPAAPAVTGAPVGPTDARRSSKGRVAWSILWALIPLLSFGFLTPTPFVHAAIRLRTRPEWMFAAVYSALWVVALVPLVESDDWSFGMILMVIATVHAFVLRQRVFTPTQAPPVRRTQQH